MRNGVGKICQFSEGMPSVMYAAKKGKVLLRLSERSSSFLETSEMSTVWTKFHLRSSCLEAWLHVKHFNMRPVVKSRRIDWISLIMSVASLSSPVMCPCGFPFKWLQVSEHNYSRLCHFEASGRINKQGTAQLIVSLQKMESAGGVIKQLCCK